MTRTRPVFMMLAALAVGSAAATIAAEPDDAQRAMVREILARPLFDPTRRPAPVVPDAAPAAGVAVLDARLAGVISSGPGARALFEVADGMVVARIGDDVIDGWRLEDLLENEARLSNGLSRVGLFLAGREGEVAAAGPAPGRVAARSGDRTPALASSTDPDTATASGADAAAGFEGLAGLSADELDASFASVGLGGFAASGASFQGRRVVDGRSASAADLPPLNATRPIDRFDGAGASAARPAPERTGDFADLGAATAVGADDFFGEVEGGGATAPIAGVLTFPASDASFRGRFVTRQVSLMARGG